MLRQSAAELLAQDSNYGYRPSIAVNSIFLALFIGALIASVFLTAKYRAWWILPLAIGVAFEVAGYVARVYATSTFERLFLKDPFLAQLVLLVIAPVLFAAVNYTVLGFLVERGGKKCSLLGGRHFLFTIIFVTCDFLSLVVQSVGGAMASLAADKGESTTTGTHIMVGGIAFQTITMGIFLILFVEYLVRTYRRPSDWRPKEWKIQVSTLFVSSIFILIRSIYRFVELAQGWQGFLITHESYFLVLDGLLMLLVVYTHLIVFPPRYIRSLKRDNDDEKLDYIENVS